MSNTRQTAEQLFSPDFIYSVLISHDIGLKRAKSHEQTKCVFVTKGTLIAVIQKREIVY